MLTSKYLTFDLEIHHITGENYFVIARSPRGETQRLEFQKEQLFQADALPPGNPAAAGSSAKKNRLFIFEDEAPGNLTPFNSQPLTLDQSINFGKRLFSTIFQAGIRMSFVQTLVEASGQKSNLRIRFNLTNAPELAVLPWEYLCSEEGLFFAKDRRTPLVRYLNNDKPIEELLVSDIPLRVLVVISEPENQGNLNTEAELENINAAFRQLEESGQIEISLLANATLPKLEEKLMLQPAEQPFHVLHYIGHGVFDHDTRQGSLMLEDEHGRASIHSSEELSEILRNFRSLRLVVLNSCEGASVSAQDSYSGIAQDFLSLADIPAVIAMQYEISDGAALVFSRRFYQMIAKGQPIEEAVFGARLAMSSYADKTEWVTPVIYMRSKSGNLFDFKKAAPGDDNTAPSLIINPTNMDKHYRAVINSILEGKLIPFLGLDANLYGRKESNPWTPETVLPSSHELAAYLAAEYEYPFRENLDLTSVSQYAVIKDSSYINPLYTRLSRIFNGNYNPTDVHRLIAKIALLARKSNHNETGDPVRRRFVVVTTNYDKLLEKAFENTDLTYHIVTYTTKGRFFHAKYKGSQCVMNPEKIDDPTSYYKLSDLDPVILKLPGAFDREEEPSAITEDHYSDYLSYKVLSGLLPPQLTNKLRTSNNLFLGSSLRNWYLRALLYRVWEGKIPGDVSWVVHPNLSKIDKEFWTASNIQTIGQDFDNYILELDEHLQNI